ncbi:hypothetical protein Q4575_04815 [Psychrosphaera sp. 1_MG-2023]|uniref:hypothetical protein n=1 Tax=Psychrosphaera sp. 1_MG-2023 TaxID=3062643 RepID=UPI0026E28BD6|nr:hypothetical protein [Psychrosphaera sp. 1_MG-2023]MDO6718709.1 hypothetical protein [Psychrosphaera sp. 1_MG-2023]
MSENTNVNRPLIRHCDFIYEIQCITSFNVDASTLILSNQKEIDEHSVRGMGLTGEQVKLGITEIKQQAESLVEF